jgi:hypothetical protein
MAGTINQQVLASNTERFASGSTHGRAFLTYVERQRLQLTRVEQDEKHPSRWWIYVVFPASIKQMFDTDQEILVMYTEWPQLQPRALDDVATFFKEHGRLDQNIVLIAGIDPTVEKYARNPSGRGYSIVPLDLSQLGSPTFPILKHLLAQWLPLFDRYDVTTPVQRGVDFFGRSDDIQGLEYCLGRSQSVGLFGLRKAGKTSLLNAVAATRTEVGRAVVKLDLSKVSSGDHFRGKLLDLTFDCVAARLHWGQAARAKCVSTHHMVSHDGSRVTSDRELLREHWLDDLTALISEAGTRLELFLDEIDTAFPGQGAQFEFDVLNDFYVIFRQLRGLLQSNTESEPGVVMACAGVNPVNFEQSIMSDGRNNQLYRVVQVRYLAPLNEADTSRMIRELGSLMGIKYRDVAVSRKIFELYGGHPLLTRKVCSQLSKLRPEGKFPWSATVNELDEVVSRRGLGSIGAETQEIWKQFSQWFPKESEVLAMLNSSEPDEVAFACAVVEDDSSIVQHAVGYGLLRDDGVSPRISLTEALQR